MRNAANSRSASDPCSAHCARNRSAAPTARQRERWHRGLLETLFFYRRLIFNPRFGAMGLIAFPFYLFGEALAPLVEVFGYLGVGVGLTLGIVNLRFAWLFLSSAILYGVLLSVWSILLEELTFRRYERKMDVFRDKRLLVGLGPAAKASLVEIRWPSGVVQKLHDVASGQTLRAEEPAS